MECENCFCIYWKEQNCLLDKISIDTFGRCEDCILVNIDEAILKLEREKVIESHEEQYLKWNK